MPNTYTQIYIHIIFAVEGRARLIPKAHKKELHKFISGIISKRGQKLLAIHCMPDHTHILVGLKPTIALSDLVRDIKAGSSNFISAKNWVKGKFQWQTGFGAFSYAHSQLGVVINYINNQDERHKRTSFKEEYVSFLNKFNVDYNEKYLFEWIE
ncbi:IS200/IS605 family transposase [Fulvivirga ulvae]|uniref:IS200/IS605 family transposase n=1 Tax=Fulvivirga ulvae TaxID=2904245 RepID=UPI001F452D60|nr:IS200/IS605 family transposase [Fulvivirga ulvae]UII33776.1 IS200/IS605 family transposase [Fulvivirga ulvae]